MDQSALFMFIAAVCAVGIVLGVIFSKKLKEPIR